MSCGSTQCSPTLLYPSLHTPEIPAPFARWGHRWWRIALRLLRLHDRLQQRRLLLELDDRMLADAGISRLQAIEEARKPFWK